MADRLADVATFYKYLHVKNKGLFYRGTCSEKPLHKRGGTYALGAGTYLSWDKTMAEAFARHACEPGRGKPIVETYRMPAGLRLLDAESETLWRIRRDFGLRFDQYTGDPVQARLMAERIGRLGYDGAISDEFATGIVVFDRSKLKKVAEKVCRGAPR